MGQPKVKIRREGIDFILDIFTFLCMLFLIMAPAYFYTAMPDIIPLHFNSTGEADGFASKISIWTLPLIGLLVFSINNFLIQYPHKFTYITDINKENAQKQYRLAVRMLRFLNLTLIFGLSYIALQTIRSAMGKAYGLNNSLLISMIGLSLCISLVFLIKSLQNK